MARLEGMKSICDYVHRSEDTVQKMIRLEGMPGEKIGGIWESDTESIDKWIKSRVENGSAMVKKPENKNERPAAGKRVSAKRF